MKTKKKKSLSILNCQFSIAIVALLLLPACGTTSTTTTTTKNYDSAGVITSEIVVVEESDTSDLAAYINAGDGNVTSLNGDISKFYLGYNGIGLSWLSVSGGRQKAPVNSKSNSAEALEKIAEVVKAAKTTITTESVAVNSDLAGSTETESTEE